MSWESRLLKSLSRRLSRKLGPTAVGRISPCLPLPESRPAICKVSWCGSDIEDCYILKLVVLLDFHVFVGEYLRVHGRCRKGRSRDHRVKHVLYASRLALFTDDGDGGDRILNAGVKMICLAGHSLPPSTSSTSTSTAMQTPRSTQLSILGKRTHRGELSSPSNCQQLQTPDPTPNPKRPKTTITILDGDGNKENIPPYLIRAVNGDSSSPISARAARALRRTSTEAGIASPRRRPCASAHHSLFLIFNSATLSSATEARIYVVDPSFNAHYRRSALNNIHTTTYPAISFAYSC